MKILHTSDWHLGRSLLNRKRYNEYERFLDWLAETIERENINVLLVAGDIFDTATPTNRSQEIYYRFLCRVSASLCKSIVIIAGNHDSAAFLNAPKAILRVLNIHISGSASERTEDEVLTLRDRNGRPMLIVGAVPYLRDRDIRISEPDDTPETKERKMIEGIAGHYRAVCAKALKERENAGVRIPIVMMGHLFVAGGKAISGDGMRELYVGSLIKVPTDIFPDFVDYTALGHLHAAQRVGASHTVRYSGAPFQMCFCESNSEKKVLLVEFPDEDRPGNISSEAASQGNVACPNAPIITEIPVPVFQKIERISGDKNGIFSRLNELKSSAVDCWVEIVCESEKIEPDLRESLEKFISGSTVEILRIRNDRVFNHMMQSLHEHETLDDLEANDVFNRCLEANAIPPEERESLLSLFNETLQEIYEEDRSIE